MISREAASSILITCLPVALKGGKLDSLVLAYILTESFKNYSLFPGLFVVPLPISGWCQKSIKIKFPANGARAGSEEVPKNLNGSETGLRFIGDLYGTGYRRNLRKLRVTPKPFRAHLRLHRL